jgi:cytochrome P450 family 130
MYARLRDADPAHHVEDGDYWVLSRYSDVQAAVLDTTRYSSASGLTVSYGDRAAAGLEEVAPLVMMDPPDHTKFRALIGRGYTPRRVADIEPQVRQFVHARLDVIGELGRCDIVAELFRPVPSFVVASYLGVPQADRARFDNWTRGIVEANAASGPTEAADTAAELFGYFAALIKRRRSEPADDTISDLVRLMDGDAAGTLRILGFAFTMIAGGNDTVTGLLSGAAELLTSNPDQRQLLGRPDLLPAATEELLRLTSPVQCLARTLTCDTVIHGRRIPTGRKVLLLYGSANRDPRVFGPDADEFDVLRGSRDGARHLAFAIGPHHCLGAAAARLQARVVLQQLLARFPRFAVDAAAGTFAPGNYTRRYATLPFTT